MPEFTAKDQALETEKIEIPAISEVGTLTAPADSGWKNLAALRQQSVDASAPATPVVDVVVPVYRGFDETMACVYAAVATTLGAACEVVVINDGSPDEELVAALNRWSRLGLFSLVHNDGNLGFVHTVNRGMALHPNRDVVLLNSDAIVYGTWLERLRRAATSCDNVATVTPFSNNAEICSYPFFVNNHPQRLEIDDAALDAIAANCNRATVVEIPTGVGFCMYIRRKCLDKIGGFDAAKFGKGYGEENDFCLRAARKGWVHLLAADVFVRHCGGVSFGAAKDALVLKGLGVLAKYWPGYDARIQRFIAEDPVFSARRKLDAARVEQACKGRQAILFVSHDWGGGIERHVRDMVDKLRTEDVDVVVMRSSRAQPGWVVLEHARLAALPNLRFRLQEENTSILDVLRSVGIFHVHVHSLAGYPLEGAKYVARLAMELGVRYDFTVHDYLAACPRINLIDGSGVYCGQPAPDVCARCIDENGAPVPVDSIYSYRERNREFLDGARRVFAPNADVASRLQHWFPSCEVQVRPHLQHYRFAHPVPVRYRGDGVLRVAIIGAIGPHKGSALILACARDAKERDLPIRFVVFGITDKPELDAHPLVTVKGAYQQDELGPLLRGHRCHLAFFSSVWPETWSYTFSEALDVGLFPVAFDLGAVADRIKRIGWGECLPLEWMTRAGAVNDALLALRWSRFTAVVRHQIIASQAIYRTLLHDYYGLRG